MITTDAVLLQAVIDQSKTLVVRTAERLRSFIRKDFDPASDASWSTAEQLWHAAYWTRLGDREQFEVHHEPPPIPQRRFDWHATERDYDLGRPMGFGPTPAAAIEDLQEQLT